MSVNTAQKPMNAAAVKKRNSAASGRMPANHAYSAKKTSSAGTSSALAAACAAVQNHAPAAENSVTAPSAASRYVRSEPRKRARTGAKHSAAAGAQMKYSRK